MKRRFELPISRSNWEAFFDQIFSKDIKALTNSKMYSASLEVISKAYQFTLGAFSNIEDELFDLFDISSNAKLQEGQIILIVDLSIPTKIILRIDQLIQCLFFYLITPISSELLADFSKPNCCNRDCQVMICEWLEPFAFVSLDYVLDQIYGHLGLRLFLTHFQIKL